MKKRSLNIPILVAILLILALSLLNVTVSAVGVPRGAVYNGQVVLAIQNAHPKVERWESPLSPEYGFTLINNPGYTGMSIKCSGTWHHWDNFDPNGSEPLFVVRPDDCPGIETEEGVPYQSYQVGAYNVFLCENCFIDIYEAEGNYGTLRVRRGRISNLQEGDMIEAMVVKSFME